MAAKRRARAARLLDSPLFWGVVSSVVLLAAALLWYPPMHQKSYAPVSGEAFISERADRVPLNSANLQELMLLPGIGAEKAAEILLYREQNGPFESPEQLAEVKGIGPATLEKILPHLTLE